MNQKKTMELWQMIVLLILLSIILATMFLPAYHINSDTLKEGMEEAQIEEDFYKNDKARDKDIKKYTKKFDKEVEKEEKENGTDNNSISILKIMTSSLADIRYNGKYNEDYTESEMGRDNYNALSKKHFMSRVFLWVIYGLALVMILITILGYCLKLNKYIPLTINVVYGIFAAVIFGILRFGTINGVKKEVGELTKGFIGINKLNNINTDMLASSFLSHAFLIGMAVSVALLFVALIAMFVGGQTDWNHQDEALMKNGGEDDWRNDWNKEWESPALDDVIPPTLGEGYYSGTQGSTFSDGVDKEAEATDIQNPQISEKLVAQNGKVRCTKGATSGTPGYALPQDRKVIVGKSPQRSDLVIINNARISNIHCTVRYNAETNTYKVKDHSTNGTFVNGARLPKETFMEYPAGTVLSLADGSVEITLG